jgi:hypothetical protein
VNRANKRYYRTILLGVLAMAALVWVAVRQFGISRAEMSELLLGTLLAIGIVIVLAGLAVALWMGLRKLLGRGGN